MSCYDKSVIFLELTSTAYLFENMSCSSIEKYDLFGFIMLIYFVNIFSFNITY